MLSTYCFSCSTVLEECRRLLTKQLLQQVKISQILSFFFSLSLTLCDMNVNWRIGFFIQLLCVQQKELLQQVKISQILSFFLSLSLFVI
jgi:hypothetical protein